MSAYVVSDKAISTIVKTLVLTGTLQPVEAVSFGQMMLNLNTHSVNVRYQESSPAHAFEYSEPELNINDPKTQIQVMSMTISPASLPNTMKRWCIQSSKP